MIFFMELILIFSLPLIIIWLLSKFGYTQKLNQISLLKSAVLVFVICPIFTLIMLYIFFTFPGIKDLNTLFLGGDIEKRISEYEAEGLFKQCKIGRINDGHPGEAVIFLKNEYDAREYYVIETNNIRYLMNKYIDKCGKVPSVLP
jgi:hypothetical protein